MLEAGSCVYHVSLEGTTISSHLLVLQSSVAACTNKSYLNCPTTHQRQFMAPADFHSDAIEDGSF